MSGVLSVCHCGKRLQFFGQKMQFSGKKLQVGVLQILSIEQLTTFFVAESCEKTVENRAEFSIIAVSFSLHEL